MTFIFSWFALSVLLGIALGHILHKGQPCER